MGWVQKCSSYTIQFANVMLLQTKKAASRGRARQILG